MGTAQVVFVGERPEVTSVTLPEEALTVTGSMFCACATGSFCTTITVVPWLPVTEGHVTPKGVEGCAHVQPEVAQNPPLFTGSWLQEMRVSRA